MRRPKQIVKRITDFAMIVLFAAALNLPAQNEPWQSNPAETAADAGSTDTTEMLTDENNAEACWRHKTFGMIERSEKI